MLEPFTKGPAQGAHAHTHTHQNPFLKTKNKQIFVISDTFLFISRRYSRVWGVDIVNGHSTLDASQSKTCRFVLLVLKYGNTSVLQDQDEKQTVKAGLLMQRKHQRPRPHLVFERRIYSAKLGRLVLQLIHDKAPLSCGHHGHGVLLNIGVRYKIKHGNGIIILHEVRPCSSGAPTTSAQ